MAKGMQQQKLAVESGYWPLYRFNPARAARGENPFQLDSGDPKISLEDYVYTETRYRMLRQADPETAKLLLARAQEAVRERWQQYKQMAERK
jgi:pyruvate-ferredoxin/flavodoxin oxidoreductase